MDLELQEFIELKRRDEDQVDLLMKKMNVLDFPDMHTQEGAMTEYEESVILANVIYRKSNVKVIVSQGSMCICGHGKVKHAYGHNSYNASECLLKTCDCYSFSKQR